MCGLCAFPKASDRLYADAKAALQPFHNRLKAQYSQEFAQKTKR
jgi:hypothetical protein